MPSPNWTPSLRANYKENYSKFPYEFSRNLSTSSTYTFISLAEASFTGNPFLQSMGMYALADIGGFLISIATGSHVHLDLIGSGAFALASIPNILATNPSVAPHQFWSSIAVTVWATKLASFLCFRATQVGRDMRLEDTLSTTSGAFGFWFITFIWNVLCSLPYTLGLMSTRSNPIFVSTGGALYVIGLLIETVADLQKYSFKQNNPGKFCKVGLWAYSQHPNFFGNLVLWAGIFLMNVPALIHPNHAAGGGSSSGFVGFWAKYHRLFMACLSPLFMWSLFYGQASGSVTNATELTNTKYGSDPEYQKYMKEVPKIFPKFW